MESIQFALNATMPVFLVILLGFFLQRVGMTNDNFNKVANEYVYKLALPVSLFRSIAGMDFYSDFDPVFCLFCLVVTTAMCLLVWIFSRIFVKDKSILGAFALSASRSNAVILGVAFTTSIYGEAGMAPMMILVAIPFFSIYSVMILCFSPQIGEDGALREQKFDAAALKKAARNVLTNPLILGILAGIPFTLFRLPVPVMLDSALKSVGNTASPLALIVIGASFSGKEALGKLKPALAATFIKLVALPAIFLPAAMALGFRDSAMVALLIMVGAPTAVNCYVMAKNMHADGVLTSNVILLSTLLSSVTITGWLVLMKSMGFV